MFMQFPNSKKLIVIAIVVFLSCAVLGQQKQKTGSLVGTISFGNEETRTFTKFSPKTLITLISRGQKKIIISSEEGDYLPELPVGKYCIFSVESEDGEKLTLWASQGKCFKISSNKTTRFDINLLALAPAPTPGR